MHAKVMLIDDDFASVGTANLDNRSMFLNFEVNCLLQAIRHSSCTCYSFSVLLLFTRDTFWMVVRQSVIFAVSAVFLKALIGIITAHLVNNLPAKGRREVARHAAGAVGHSAVALDAGWWWLFDPTYSAFNWLLERLFGAHVSWLSDPYWARFCAVLVNVWYGSPFFLIMYLAALKSVPGDLYEAASINGASAWQKLIHITLPMMRNIIAITVLFSLIVTFANYDIVRVLTAGGPRDMTHVFATWAFKLGIESGDIPLGASVSLYVADPRHLRHLHPARRAPARQGGLLMTAVTADIPRPTARGSLRRNRAGRSSPLISSSSCSRSSSWCRPSTRW